MADLKHVARPYAKAVFELARAGDDLASWSRQLAALAALVQDDQLKPLLSHPRLTRDALAAVLTEALGAASDTAAANLVRLLVENGRLFAASAISEQFEQLRAEAERVVDVTIATATEVPPAQRDALVAAVGRRLERKLDVQWETDPALIAGAVIRAGDFVIDGSVRSELERMQTVLSQ